MSPRSHPDQQPLFEAAALPTLKLPSGLVYQDAFLSMDEEAAWIAVVQALPLEAAKYKSYTARRRVLSYGGSFDYDANRLQPTQPLIEALHPLRTRVAGWMGLASPDALVHALLAKYRPGTPLGWHRDVPNFDQIAGVSLGTPALMRLRPYPPLAPKRADVLRLPLEPRSIYRMQGAARWQWQHSVAPTPGLRWSITFRTERI